MTEPLEQLMARLRAEYLAEIPGRLEEMAKATEQFALGTPGSREDLARLFHRLAGSSGAYGFEDVTRHCRDTEQALRDGLSPDEADRIRTVLEQVRNGFGG